MDWQFDGEWQAVSGDWIYRIVVTKDGQFDVSDTDRELGIGGIYRTLQRAKCVCEQREHDRHEVREFVTM
jgi:hypothetical protein